MGPGSARATVIRVPEDRGTIDLAVSQAEDGDTLSLAPGSYNRVPAPFTRDLVLRGRGAGPEETILIGLRVGRARIENLTFQLAAGPAPDPVLVEANDSLTLTDCVFRGPAIGVRAAAPAIGPSARIRIERCRFDNVLLGVELLTDSPDGPRVEVVASTFDGPISGITVSRTPESCVGSGNLPPPEIDPSEALIRLDGCLFDNILETAVSVSMVDDGLAAASTSFVRCGTPIALRLAGASLNGCTLTGSNRVGRGIHALGGRIDLSGCTISGFEYGVSGFPFGTCRDSGGRIGPSLAEQNNLGGNSIALAGGTAFDAGFNFWGLLTCDGVNGLLEPTDTGSPRVRVLLDEGGNAVADCSTPTRPTSWTAVKARFAGPEARH